MNNKGLHHYRTTDPLNKLEKQLAESWEAENNQWQLLEYLLGNGNERAIISDRDIEVAATVIQWLGSDVGLNFLKKNGLAGE